MRNQMLIELSLSFTFILAAAICDLRCRRFPNWLAVTGLLGGIVLRLRDAQVPTPMAIGTFLLALLAAFLLMGVDAWGAGDAKFLIVLMLAFPSQALFISILAGLLGWQLGGLLYCGLTRSQRRFESLPLVLCFALGWVGWAAARLAG